MQEDQIWQIARNILQKFDANKSGALDREELKHFLKNILPNMGAYQLNLIVENVMRKFDQNNDHELQV